MYIDIDTEISRYAPCNALKPHQVKEPLQLHEIPDIPWSFMAADLFDWHGKTHLVLVNSFSGWFELDYLSDMRSNTVIAKLKINVSVHGIPHTLMTDNATQLILQIMHTHGTLSMFTAALTIANPMGLQSVQSDLPSIFWKSATVNILTSALLFSTSAIFPGMVYRPLHNAFFSRKTRTFLPVTKPLLQPVIHTDVKETITKQRLRGKEYYDRNAHQLLALKPRQTVRMQTARGFDRLATVNSPAEQPNSYVVTSQGTKYIRNR